MSFNQSDYEIEVDAEKNRVFLTQYGMYDDETATAMLDELDRKTGALPEGFDLVNDIREFKPLEQQKTKYIEPGKEIVAENGVGALVRIVDSAITAMQFERVGDGDEAYHVATAETPREAERMLDRLRAEQNADVRSDE